MNELTIDGKTYVSSKRAAEITGYAKDYVGQLCREGHVEARLVGRNWYVREASIREHRFGKKDAASAAAGDQKLPSTWETPRYEAEIPTELPQVTRKTPVLSSNMESAWKEWFAMQSAVKEPLAKPVREINSPEEESESGTALEAAVQDPDEVEIPITPIPVLTKEQEEEDERPAEMEEEKAVRQEHQTRIQRGRRGSHLILQGAFIAVALLSMAIAAIGTGYAQKVSDLTIYRLSEINFIAGVSIYNKP